jgi:hypothetical protein
MFIRNTMSHQIEPWPTPGISWIGKSKIYEMAVLSILHSRPRPKYGIAPLFYTDFCLSHVGVEAPSHISGEGPDFICPCNPPIIKTSMKIPGLLVLQNAKRVIVILGDA